MIISDEAVVIKRRSNKVIYRDNDRIIKVFDRAKPASDVYNESLNTARVMEVGVRVSEPLEVSQVEEGEHAGCWALSNRYVPGTTLYDLWQENPDGLGDYLEQLIDLQLEVSDFHAPLLNRQKEKLGRMVSETKGIIDATTRYDLHVRVESMRNEVRVCHGDFIPSNVIVGEDGRLHICDWAHATAGSPEVDAAMTYLLFCINYPDNAELYLERYCARADVARQVIDYWIPVVAAAELSRGYGRHEEFLKKCANIYGGK